MIRSAVILCGGKGSRLGNLSKKIPKSLVRIKGKPIIWYILKILKKNKFNHFILPIGYKGSMIKKYITNNNNFKNYNIDIVDTGIDTTIAERIFMIKTKILSSNFLLLNGDAIFDFNIEKIYKEHLNNKDKMTFIGCQNELPYGTLGIKNNKIVSFDRNIIFNSVNVKDEKNFRAYIYSGMSIMNTLILKQNYKHFKNFEKSLYPLLIKKFKCKFVPLKGFWHSIDNIKDIGRIENKTNNLKYRQLVNIIKKLK